MGHWILFIVGLAAMLATLFGARAYRRSTVHANVPDGGTKIAAQAKRWNVRISVPSDAGACLQVGPFLGKEFPKRAKPPLPLESCSMPLQCKCRYIEAHDRRTGERRSGVERRWDERIAPDKAPRRSGNDRRKQD